MTMGKGIRKAVSLLLAASMVLAMTGCGGGNGGTGERDNANESVGGSTGTGTGEPGGTGQGDNNPVAMGRYVEAEVDLSEQTGSRVFDMCRRSDGSLVILCPSTLLVSKDEGVTWESEIPQWLADMIREDTYISNMYMAPDGTVAVIYGMNIESGDSNEPDYIQALKLVLPDGTQVPVELELAEGELYVRQAAVNDDGGDGIFYVSTYRGIYEVARDGSYEKVLEIDYNPQWMWVQDDLLFIDNDYGEIDMPMIYDLDGKEQEQDEVLTEFMADNYGDRGFNGTDYCEVYLLPGEDGTVYIIGNKGIHRHAVGGNMMEQIVDGNLSLLSNPSYTINDAIQLEGDAFLILFSNSKVVRFTYDSNVPAVPENMVTIYSLKEDTNIRQAISFYQTKHPDSFVSYQIGMSDGDSMTREDALKKLNTEIMAGEGPDLLVMDNLPFDSYVDKGLLLDLTDYLTDYSKKEPLFDNVIEALKRDGKAYVAPATIAVPQIAGKTDGMERIVDLTGLAEVVEKLREEKPGEDILGISNELGILKRFAATSAPKWITEEGTIDRDSIGEYLEQCRRIADAQMNGLDEDIRIAYEEQSERLAAYHGVTLTEVNRMLYLEIIGFIGGTQQLMAGWSEDEYTFTQMTSLDQTKGFENTKVVPMQGQCSHIFKPASMLAISAASEQTDMAKEFMDTFLSAEVQGMYTGLPLNQNGFDIQYTPKTDFLGENGEYGSWATSNEDGIMISFQAYWPSEEEIAAFKAELAALDTAYIPDHVLEKAVFDQGILYMRGDQSLDKALDEIEREVSIYMAE